MRTSAARTHVDEEEVFSAADIARAAGVEPDRVVAALGTDGVAAHLHYLQRADAIRLVRALRNAGPPERTSPFTLIAETRRRQGLPLVASALAHAAFIAVLVLAATGLFQARETEQRIDEPRPVRLVYFIAPGPGGGGGGGGLKMPAPAVRAERQAPPKAVHKISSPVRPVHKTPPPPKPAVVDPPKAVEPQKIDPPKIDPPKIDPPKPAPQAVQAPVAPMPADAATKPGVLDRPPAPTTSAGPGTGGGTGTGAGTGMGAGRGGGIGDGTGGGVGAGPYQPGAGIEPPSLLREVKPLYTEEARKRSIEGAVVLEIVVRRDGSVSNVRVTRSLDPGLNEKAIEAVRQWRFAPARRQGAPVDVIVEVSVEFKLR